MKITATIHQLQLNQIESDTLNRIGRAAAHELDTKFLAYDDIKINKFVPEYWEFYQQQGEIEVDTDVTAEIGIERALEHIFAAGNDDGYGPWADRYNRYETAYSISVGDIIVIGESAWMVGSYGWEQVELAQGEVA